MTVSDVAARLNDRIDDLARVLFGDPNAALSTRTQLRFRSKGSVAVEVAGAIKGRWYDHEAGAGGDALELVRHVRGLTNGAAVDWAHEWLGIAPRGGQGPSQSPARKNRQRSSSTGDRSCPNAVDPTDSAVDSELATKVADIVAGSEPPAGTPAEGYLRNRGIAAEALPDGIRFRANAHGRYGALVALATDAGGAVHALQQIYLTDDGRKAPLKVQKRTNKARDGWSACRDGPSSGQAPAHPQRRRGDRAFRLAGNRPGDVGLPRHQQHRSRSRVGGCGRHSGARRRRGPAARPTSSSAAPSPSCVSRGRDVLVADAAVRQGLQRCSARRRRRCVFGPRSPQRSLPTPTPHRWRSDLIVNERGRAMSRPRQCHPCPARTRRTGKAFSRHDEFATATVARRPPPWISARIRMERYLLVGSRRLPGRRVAATSGHHGAGIRRRTGGRGRRPGSSVPSRARLSRLPRIGTACARLDVWLSVLPRRRRHALHPRRRSPLADLGGRPDLSARRAGRLRADPGGAAGHPQIQRTARPRPIPGSPTASPISAARTPRWRPRASGSSRSPSSTP